MFTGIVSHCGVIEAINNNNSALRVLVKTQFSTLEVGESIAVDGACLTVAEPAESAFYCDISPETRRKTVANHYNIGTRVNIERSLQLSDRIGGHFVTGHVDDTATIEAIEKTDDFWTFSFVPNDKNGLKYVVSKGSIAINGVSLTINAVDSQSFSVMLIPHTLEITNLDQLAVNDKVNIEYDMLAKIVAKQVEVVNING
ncbi:MAG: riboflavin synthase [Coxiellaceae bacterium]|nr:riboflavin synthase [Coxiellaceae bacterium]